MVSNSAVVRRMSLSAALTSQEEAEQLAGQFSNMERGDSGSGSSEVSYHTGSSSGEEMEARVGESSTLEAASSSNHAAATSRSPASLTLSGTSPRIDLPPPLSPRLSSINTANLGTREPKLDSAPASSTASTPSRRGTLPRSSTDPPSSLRNFSPQYSTMAPAPSQNDNDVGLDQLWEEINSTERGGSGRKLSDTVSSTSSNRNSFNYQGDAGSVDSRKKGLGIEDENGNVCGEWSSSSLPNLSTSRSPTDSKRELLPRLSTTILPSTGNTPTLTYSSPTATAYDSPRESSPGSYEQTATYRSPNSSNSPFIYPPPFTTSSNLGNKNSQASSVSTSTQSTVHRSPSPNSLALGGGSRPSYFGYATPPSPAPSATFNREPHSRNLSLTSACAPVTAAYPETCSTPGSKVLDRLKVGAGIGSGSPSSPTSPSPSKGWKSYGWGFSPPSASGSPGIGPPSPTPSSHFVKSSVDIRKWSRPFPTRHNSANSPGSSRILALIGLPSAILAVFLSPLSNAPPTSHSTNITASTAPTGKSKRAPFPIRLALIAYLLFSCAFFGLRMINGESELVSGVGKDGTGINWRRLGARGGGEEGGTAFGWGAGMVGEGVSEWAMRVAEGVRNTKAKVLGDLGGARSGVEEANVGLVEEQEKVEVMNWEAFQRVNGVQAKVPETNPLTPFAHPYRFGKMHDKIHWDMHDEIEPFVFRATVTPSSSDITACFYSNEAWLSNLPSFVSAWGGPVSLVFETAHSRFSPRRQKLLSNIASLRSSDPLIRRLVDFHIVGSPPSTGERALNKTRERLILRPQAANYQLNLARFFAPTDLVFMAGDARLIPSNGLRHRLMENSMRDLMITKGDVIVVPSFGFIRPALPSHNPPPMDAETNPIPLARIPPLRDLRTQLNLPPSGLWDGVGEEEFELLASENLAATYSTIPLPRDRWPQKKSSLVQLVRPPRVQPSSVMSSVENDGDPSQIDSSSPLPTISTSAGPTSPVLALHDRRWDLNHGPSNWYLWRKSARDPHLLDPPEQGGGLTLGVDEKNGGGRKVYRVVDYDLHYSPYVVMSKKGQPWCTEKFERLHAACVYQAYLTGAELWVIPDEWTYTLEVVNKGAAAGERADPAEKLKASISSRLYGKYHQEACMHYGREFLSINMWNSAKAQHLRAVCARSLGLWGMGLVLPD